MLRYGGWKCNCSKYPERVFGRLRTCLSNDPVVPLLGIVPTDMGILVHTTDMLKNVQSSTSHNSLKLETTRIFTNGRWIRKYGTLTQWI